MALTVYKPRGSSRLALSQDVDVVRVMPDPARQRSLEIAEVLIGGELEEVYVDPQRGPVMYKFDGTIAYKTPPSNNIECPQHSHPRWATLTKTQREVFLIQVARTNHSLRTREGGKDIWAKARYQWGLYEGGETQQ
eukprot:gnl/TRDRNA2_/TRDRNA2_40388_c0_seq1.p1 gnl/TRDRNA2_/TRDRNA2_40388_c0~~gnl/TRDRNA2_/TRDRNA2_40388_c0_seq1.p1  ORF type:complete len:152 (+),score=8.21 gnl/TRDRNA2_/TRDRNA2_40388_c0_seq1:51-458(+)